MGFSVYDENALIDLLSKFKEEHKIHKSVVIIMTDNRIIINPTSKKFKSVKHALGYGEGFNDGRNDLYNEINNKYGYSPKRNKEIFN